MLLPILIGQCKRTVRVIAHAHLNGLFLDARQVKKTLRIPCVLILKKPKITQILV